MSIEEIQNGETLSSMRSKVNEIINNINGFSGESIPVLSELPEADPTKAGQRFSFNGKDWEYLTEEKIQANNWDLAVGEPWPVVGYKEYDAELRIRPNNITVTKLNVSDIEELSFEKVVTGQFSTNENVPNFTVNNTSSLDYEEGVPLWFIYQNSNDKLIIEIYSADSEGDTVDVPEEVNTTINIRFYPPPND